MRATLKKLKKLRGRGLEELRVRGGQALSASAERAGLSEQARIPSDSNFFKLIHPPDGGGAWAAARLLAHFRARTSPAFFASFADPAQTLAELRFRFGPDAGAGAVERAEKIVAGRFDLLGLRGLSFGEPIDWHLEPVFGGRAPLRHWSRIDALDPAVAGDKKVTWELNRQQYFMTLGRAYWHTGDERFADTFAAHLDSWMRENPPKLGINWASSLEVAFRSISWLWALHFFKDSPHLTAPLFVRALKFLYLHARHLETYLSTYFSPNTHLTGEALGLFYLGTLLPEFRRAANWRAVGESILLAQLTRHVRPDGVYFEQSSYYQRYTTDFYTHLLALTRANGLVVNPEVEEKLRALLDHLMHIARPDGRTPFFGDDDGGRLAPLDERPSDDFRAALSTGAALFARPDYKHAAGELAEETLWLLGPEGARAFDRTQAHPPAELSRAFASGGYYVMRDGWGSDADHLIVDCGPHGADNCGHAHADALAVIVSARGRALLTDPGTYTYTGSREWRDHFRSTAAHNTLTVDGESSSAPDGPFSWRHIARARARLWMSRARFDLFEGAHDGYERLPSPATHARSVLFLKGDYWVIRDRVETEGPHRYELRFNFAPGARPVVEVGDADDTDAACAPPFGSDASAAGTLRERPADAPGLEVHTFGRGGAWRVEEGWFSPCYGVRVPVPVCAFAEEGEGPREFVSLLVPRRAAEGRTRARELAATAGRAFELLDGERRDVLLLKDGTARAVTVGQGVSAGAQAAIDDKQVVVEAARVSADCAWAWLRFAHGGELEEFVLLDAAALSVEGREVFAAGGRAGFVCARREGGGLVIEAEAGVDFRMASFGAERAVVNRECVPCGGAGFVEVVGGRARAARVEAEEFAAG